jgi:hypothetical protein
VTMVELITVLGSGLLTAWGAKFKRRNRIGWFIYGVLMPFISLIHLALIKPLSQPYSYKASDNGPSRKNYKNDALNQKDNSNSSNSFNDYGGSAEDFEKIRNEYLKAERLKREAEEDRQKARLSRQEAEQIRQKAFEEWEKIKKNMNASRSDIKDPYDVIGVHKNDSFESIKEVYKKLIQIYHPDKYMGASGLSIKQKNELLSRINAAYDWISKHHGKI